MSGVTSGTVATAALVASAAAAAASAYGAYQQGQAAQKQGAYQAAVMRNNQILAERAAQDAEARGKIASDLAAQKGAQLKSRERAILAGNGMDVNTGSGEAIQSDTAGETAFDARMIRHNAELEAGQDRAQGMNFQASGDLAQMKGDAAANAGLTTAGATLLGSAGSVAGKWYDFKNTGAFTPKTNLGVYNDYAG